MTALGLREGGKEAQSFYVRSQTAAWQIQKSSTDRTHCQKPHLQCVVNPNQRLGQEPAPLLQDLQEPYTKGTHLGPALLLLCVGIQLFPRKRIPLPCRPRAGQALWGDGLGSTRQRRAQSCRNRYRHIRRAGETGRRHRHRRRTGGIGSRQRHRRRAGKIGQLSGVELVKAPLTHGVGRHNLTVQRTCWTSCSSKGNSQILETPLAVICFYV